MNNNGIVRKIDSLGRIVIPKDVRSVLNIKTNDDMHICVNGNEIILKKYSYATSFVDYINKLIQILPINDNIILFTDREKVINEGIYEDNLLSDNLFELIEDNKIYKSISFDSLKLGNNNINGYYLVVPVTLEYNVIGLIILISSKEINKEEEMLAKCIKALIENKINLC